MSCPDWSTLIDRRQDAEGELRWDRALLHLAECDTCRDEAHAVEPTLIFRRRPLAQPDQREIDEMKQAVAAMRRAQPIVEPARRRRLQRRFNIASLMRVAATIAVLTGSMALFNILGPAETGPPAAGPRAIETGSPAAGPLAAGSPAAADRLHIEIQVSRGSEVLAQGNLSSIEGAEMAANLGSGYKTNFKTGELSTDGSVTLRDFEVEKVSLVKSRRAPIQLHYSELELSPENPLTLTLAPSDPDGEPLVMTITWRLNKRLENKHLSTLP